MPRRTRRTRRLAGHLLNFCAGIAFAAAYIVRAPGNLVGAVLKWLGERANDAAEARLCDGDRYRSAFQQRLQGRLPQN